jgi:hypothetical protein
MGFNLKILDGSHLIPHFAWSDPEINPLQLISNEGDEGDTHRAPRAGLCSGRLRWLDLQIFDG